MQVPFLSTLVIDNMVLSTVIYDVNLDLIVLYN